MTMYYSRNDETSNVFNQRCSYRRIGTPAWPAIVAAIGLVGVSRVSSPPIEFLLLILATFSIGIAGLLTLRSQVKIQIANEGIDVIGLRRKHISWAEICDTTIIERTQGSKTQVFYRCFRFDGTTIDIEISDLDALPEDLLRTIEFRRIFHSGAEEFANRYPY